MSSELTAGSPSIFLSHAHDDKPFVRHLARDLMSAGVRVWVDEAEMDVGDSLLDKITFAISDLDYLGVVISAYSAHSDWVTREVEVAMSEEIAGKRVKVIPLLLRGGILPPALDGKLFADFTSEPAYPGSLQRLLARLGAEKSPPGMAADRLSELASSSRLLTGALAELRADGLTDSTAEALVSSKVADIELSEFLILAAEETVRSQQLFGLAISLVQYIDTRAVGHQALDICLKSGRLKDWQIGYVGMHMQNAKSSAAVLWCHSRMVTLIKSDAYYHSFLERHIDLVIDKCYDDMAAYLLQPNRGPDNYNLDSFEIVISHVENPAPFQSRLFDWINGGYFDFEKGKVRKGGMSPRVLYLILNEHWGEAKFDKIAKVIQRHVYLIMKSNSQDLLRAGMFHLVAMIHARYRGADQIVSEVLPRVYDVEPEERRLLDLIDQALAAVASYNQDPSNADLEKEMHKLYREIAAADKNGIIGFWGRH